MKKLERNNGEWVYKYDKEYPCDYEITRVRYVLGEKIDPKKSKALICIGINPSTAIPEDLDPTLKKVQKYARDNGYGAWYMLNVYPERSTDPNGIPEKCDLRIHERNIEQIKDLLGMVKEADIWCAWGDNITKRPYLQSLLYDDILSLFGSNHVLKANGTTRKGHPAHPLARIPLSRLNDLKGFSNLTPRLKTHIN